MKLQSPLLHLEWSSIFHSEAAVTTADTREQCSRVKDSGAGARGGRMGGRWHGSRWHLNGLLARGRATETNVFPSSPWASQVSCQAVTKWIEDTKESPSWGWNWLLGCWDLRINRGCLPTHSNHSSQKACVCTRRPPPPPHSGQCYGEETQSQPGL